MSAELVMPSNHHILCHPLFLLPSIFPSIRVFSNELALRIRWPKYWSFSSSIGPPNEYSGSISFRIDWLDLLAVQGTLKSLLQHHSSKASVLWCSAFFMVQLTHPYMTTGKIIALTTYWGHEHTYQPWLIHRMKPWGKVRVCILAAKQSPKGIGHWSGSNTGAGVCIQSGMGSLGLWRTKRPGNPLLRVKVTRKSHGFQPVATCEWVKSEWSSCHLSQERAAVKPILQVPCGHCLARTPGVGQPCHCLLYLRGPSRSSMPLIMEVRAAGVQALRKDCETGRGSPTLTQGWLTG